ncbi:sugar 3,4-ketoisomerase [Winogradskyella sp.]|uniref:sugar 3,4-ketoisomerase n=1 Tax=Winogradskyella sp. TaxID=1883156 RepID=UPI003F6B678E
MEVQLIDLPKIEDRRGNISVIEKECLPYEIKRVYYLYDVPSDAYRGGHAHKDQKEFLIALSGSFEVLLDNGVDKEIVMLNKPFQGLLILNGIWRELKNFSSGSVCLVLSSDVYIENDYIRNYNEFLNFVKS